MRFPEVKQQNRKMLILFLAGLILTLILMSLPLYSFDIGIYTKKSANTFVGDEKYQTVRAEVEEVAEDYRAQGFDVEIQESVLERVNSKGKTTSLVTFTVAQRYSRNLFSFFCDRNAWSRGRKTHVGHGRFFRKGKSCRVYFSGTVYRMC